MANEKISQFSPLTTLASGDYLPIVDISEPSTADQNKRVGVDVLDGRYFAAASGAASLTLAVSAQASGNAALSSASTALASGNAGISVGLTALASGNAGISVGLTALASGNAALTNAATAQASGNAALTSVAGKYDKTGGPISGPVVVQSQSFGETGTVISSGVCTLNFGARNNFEVILTNNSTFASPVNASGGQCGSITIRQDGTGSRLITYSGSWSFISNTAPTLTTSASGVDILTYYCVNPNRVSAILSANYGSGTVS